MPRSDSKEETTHSSMISVRLSPEVEEALKLEAARSGTTLSQLIRNRLNARDLADRSAADLKVFPLTTTVAISGLALEASDGKLLPKTLHPYVTFTQH